MAASIADGQQLEIQELQGLADLSADPVTSLPARQGPAGGHS